MSAIIRAAGLLSPRPARGPRTTAVAAAVACTLAATTAWAAASRPHAHAAPAAHQHGQADRLHDHGALQPAAAARARDGAEGADAHRHHAHSPREDVPQGPSVQGPHHGHEHEHGHGHGQGHEDGQAPTAAENAHAHHGHHAAAPPVRPRVTDAERAAAFPDLGRHDMARGGHHDHMDDNPFNVHVLLDRFEWQDTEGHASTAWDATAWLGRDDGRLWLRSHGARSAGRTEAAHLDVLWGAPVSPWWDAVAGIRHRFEPGPARTAAALGVIGMAPYFFEVEATALLEEGGHVSAEVEVEIELLFTQKLILQPSVELAFNGRSDAGRGIGSGLSTVEAGLRLRYEIRREFAPYIGVEWERLLGRTADFAASVGEGRSDTRLVAGLRVWF